MSYYSDQDVLAALAEHGSGRKAALALGIPRTTFQDMLTRIKSGQTTPTSLISRRNVEKRSIPRPKRGVKRFILSSVQDDTAIDKDFLRNLEAYAAHIGADIFVSGYTYGRRREAGYAPEVRQYLTTEQIDIGGKLLFCGEMRIMPTATRPLSGLETYTRSKWGVFPHPRISLKSVATMFRQPAKQIMTTGTLSKPNYSHSKAGVKSEFHHMIAALLVEIDSDGDVFCRHLIADQHGDFQDLNTYVEDGTITEDVAVTAITWGDIHVEQIDGKVRHACWGNGGMLDTLAPDYQFFHDACDFIARNHHNIGDPHHVFKMHVGATDSVEDAMCDVGEFLKEASRPWCESYVVESNHDLMLLKWLKTGDYRYDPVNAEFFLRAQAAQYAAISRGTDRHFSVFEHMLRDTVADMPPVTFLRETDSLMVANIEHALHGHKGANGAKGHINSFAKMGPKANVGHTHSPEIFEGIYCAGTSSKMNLGYNAGGLSSWAHAHIITYDNGKRTLVTMQNGKWRA